MRALTVSTTSLGGALIVGAAMFLSASNPACAVATNTTAVQCTSEAECLGLGPEFAGTTCDANTKTCIKVPQDADLCKTNKECIDKIGGQPAICKKSTRKCVNLITPECPYVIAQPGQLLDDDAIVIGMESPAQTIEIGDVMEQTVRLFQAELTKQVQGLPGVNGSTKPRPLVIATCIEFAGGYQGLIRSSTHLVKDVGVPLILGPVDTGHTAVMAPQVTLPNKVLIVQPTILTSYINDLPSPASPTPLIWSLSPNEKSFNPAGTALILSDIEPKLRAQGITGPIRIATIADGNTYGSAIADNEETILTFNGKTAVQNAADGNYARFTLGDSLDKVNNPSPEEGIAKVIAGVYAFKPHIIIDIYQPSTVTETLFPLVFGWPKDVFFPYHVDLFNTFGAFQPLYSILDMLPFAQDRFYSVQSRQDADRLARAGQWLIKFNAFSPTFKDSQTQQAPLVQQWYDSAYVAAYAIAALGDKPLTGENLGKTIPLLTSGPRVRVGTEDLAGALENLKAGKGIDLDGITGSLDLDPAHGTVKYEIDLLCPQKGPDGKIVNFKPSGFYLDKNEKGVGTSTCPLLPK